MCCVNYAWGSWRTVDFSADPARRAQTYHRQPLPCERSMNYERAISERKNGTIYDARTARRIATRAGLQPATPAATAQEALQPGPCRHGRNYITLILPI